MTNSLQCFIIDDEERARQNLKLLLQQFCPDVEIVGEAGDINIILNILPNTKADVLFLDVQIDYHTIFDILDKVELPNCQIILVSAYDQYAIEGYKYNVIDYILKPIDPNKLIAAVKRATDEIIKNFRALKTQQTNSINNTENNRIAIPDINGFNFIDCDDIIYCESDGNYTNFIITPEKKIVFSKNLKYVESKLNPYGFFRVHKSYLINTSKIKAIFKEDGGYLVMNNDQIIPIARTSKKELYDRINKI